MTSQRRELACNLLLILGLSVATVTGPAGSATAQVPVTELNRLLGKLPEPNAICSAAVVDLQTGRRVFGLNTDRPMIPASNVKLFALAAAVEVLGPDFQFRTVLATRGSDLVVIGDGDPSLGDPVSSKEDGREITAVIDEWAAVLKERGLSNVKGDLIIDESIFDDRWVHPEWPAEDIRRRYAAPVGALNFNENCIEVTVWPARRAGQPVQWSARPRTSLIDVKNRCKSGGRNRPTIDRPSPTFQYVLGGSCTKRSTLQSVPVPDPGLFFADVLRLRLADQGVTIAGRVRRERVRDASEQLPADCEILAVHTTPLLRVAARAGKDSQNLFAECLLKRAGYEFAKTRGTADPIGSWETGRASVQALMSRAGIDPDAVVISDGSGLSRANRASVSDFVKLLAYMQRHRGWDVFGRSLSVAGRDGLLRKRMNGVPGLVCAKTGYMQGVRTLSGYVETPDGRLYCFSVLFNNIKKATRPFSKIQDQFCRILASG
ncbi:MAG: D-alanyl-D-alanine carboxypeptidase/D-alanyl-D-alanine-endopeptidase [Phycisphaerales bacterium]|nr:MAG: D-alanyl-D-alanine carboxypeptidase/D-alanyl-D-alanine-endopeptidase [Phycisphaerales bacterium]